jgi:hypothetical protein
VAQPRLFIALEWANYLQVPFYNAVYIGYRLALTPDELRGRVNSVARLIAFGFSPLGLALTGISLQYTGPRITVLLAVGVQAFLALAAMLNGAIRRARPLAEP